MDRFEVRLSKQAEKYIISVDNLTRKKLLACLEEISIWKGDIVPLKDKPNYYRYKVHHYRFILHHIKNEIIVTVIKINTRTNIKY